MRGPSFYRPRPVRSIGLRPRNKLPKWHWLALQVRACAQEVLQCARLMWPLDLLKRQSMYTDYERKRPTHWSSASAIDSKALRASSTLLAGGAQINAWCSPLEGPPTIEALCVEPLRHLMTRTFQGGKS